MEDDVVIKVEGLSKKFSQSLKRSMAYGTIDLIRNFFNIPTDQSQLRKSEFWALKDINFELKKGEILGVIGVNGSGKSTLLRILTGIFPPDMGKVTVKGNIGALIAVGAGFHPHFTGRENIYLNGTVLGMSREEIDEKFDEIVKFADIGNFLDAPVATYSSGMKVRLGFAVAIHSVPEVLLVDEVLSVGDIAFKKKCMEKMEEIKKNASIIFVSHSMNQVERICDKAILLDKGEVVYAGSTLDTIQKYYEQTLEDERLKTGTNLTIFESTGDIQDLNLDITDIQGNKKFKFNYGEDIVFDFTFSSRIDIKEPNVGIVIYNDEGIAVGGTKTTREVVGDKVMIKKGKNHFTIKLKESPFMSGNYRIAFRWRLKDGTGIIDAGGIGFTINPSNNLIGLEGVVKLDTEWKQFI